MDLFLVFYDPIALVVISYEIVENVLIILFGVVEARTMYFAHGCTKLYFPL